MVAQSSSKSVDLEKLVDRVAKLELKALNAGVECVQVWISQAAKLSTIASDTLQAMQHDKSSLSDTARRLTEFGRQNGEVFGSLATRLNATYYDELGQLADALSTQKIRSIEPTAVAEQRASPKAAPAKSSERAARVPRTKTTKA